MDATSTPWIRWQASRSAWLRLAPASWLGLFLRALFALATFLDCLQAFFAALGAFRGSLHQFRADQLEHGLFGAIAFAPTQSNHAGVSSAALSEAGTQLV